MLLHVDVFVAEMDRSVAFYTRNLGGHVIEDGVIEGEPAAVLTGGRSTRMRLVLIAFARGGMVELMQPLDGAPSSAADDGRRLGVSHMTFLVEDLDAKLRDLASVGVTVASETSTIDLPKAGRTRLAFIRDPDGNLVELVEGAAGQAAAGESRPLTDEERECLLALGRGPAAEVSAVASVPQLFAEQVAARPDAVAVDLEGRQLTYAELDARSNQLAHHLLALGVTAETRVGIALERSFEMIVGVLAILKAGGAYVPLDPSYPPARLAFMIEDTQMPLLVTQERVRSELPAFDGQVVLVDADAAAIAARPATRPADEAGPGSLAYVIYTSGSTGRPKGVAMTHGPLVNLLLWQAGQSSAGPGAATLQFAPLGFDVSFQEIFATLGSGGTLVLIDEAARLDVRALLRLLRERNVVRLFLPPVALQHLADVATNDGTFPESLRELITAGEQLQISPALRTFFAQLPRAKLVNQYGPTECHVVSSYTLEGPSGSWPALPPIGAPISNTHLYVLDEDSQPVPEGVPGELFIGGAAVARGYLGDPERTAESFVPDPFSQQADARLYRTGDQARWLPDGNLEFLGRGDQQVKIRGFRIELGEIEATLLRHDAVRGVAVLCRQDTPGEKRLVAYVVPSEGDVDADALRHFLETQLPGYMVPASYMRMDALPLSPNGKIDRAALPAPEDQSATASWVAPRDALERELARLWESVLGVERVGVHDSFFHHGGDSITAARMLMELERLLGDVLYVTAIFDAPTVGEFAAYLRKHYPDGVLRLTAPDGGRGGAVSGGDDGGRPEITPQHVEQLRSLITVAPAHTEAPAPRNPRAVFILAPPRSGTTLFRVMLAGHPELFAPPELELLSFTTLRERRRACEGRYSFALEGALRALMELRGCDAAEAQRVMDDLEARDLTVHEFYRQLQQEWIAPRMLAEKSTSYAQDPEVLRRIEADFEDPLYIHLVRHPCAMIHSYKRMRIDRSFRFEHPFTGRQLGELLWLVENQNILQALRELPSQRQRRVRFEDLLRDPRAVMEGLCRFLGLGFDPLMLEPYDAKQRDRMTDGLHEGSRMFGDPEFHKHSGIDARVASGWVGAFNPATLADATRELAVEVGYPPLELAGGDPAASDSPRVRADGVDDLSDDEVAALLREMDDEDREGPG